MNTAPFAALFLILTAVPGIVHVAKGLPLRIATMSPCYPGDRRVVVIRVLPGGQLMINVDLSSWTELGGFPQSFLESLAHRSGAVIIAVLCSFRALADL
jgi:hypothetical protein